jgi:hypothetical protein
MLGPLLVFYCGATSRDSEAGGLVKRLSIPPAAHQFIDRPQDPAPDHHPVKVTQLRKLFTPLGCTNWRIGAMLVDHQLRGAEDVGVVDHSGATFWRSLQTAPPKPLLVSRASV